MPGDPSRSHLPAPSYWPLVISVGFPLVGYGLIYNLALSAVGAALILGGIVGWALEPPDDEDLPPHGHDDHGDPSGAEAAALEQGEPEPDLQPAEPEVAVIGEEVTVDG